MSIVLLLWGLLAPGAQAQPQKISVAVGSDSTPFYFLDKGGLPQGLLVDLWKIWSQKTGVAVEFKPAAFGQTLTMVGQGQADAHAGCFMSEQRKEYLDFVIPVCSVQTNLFVHHNIFGIDGLEDLAGFRVGVIAGDYALEHLAGKLPQTSLAVYPDNLALFKAIEKGECLVFVKDTAIALEQLSQRGIFNRFRFDIERPLYERQWFAAVRRGDRQLAELVRQGMEQITPEERAAIELRWIKSASVKTKDRLVISCPKGNAPFTTLTPTGRPSGLLVDIWRLWAQKANKKIEFRFDDWAGSLRALESGQADIHSGMFHTEERATRLDLSPPFYGAQVGVFYNPKHIHPARIQDLTGQQVGAVAKSYLAGFLRENYPQLRLKEYSDSDAMIHAAVDGEVKAFAVEAAAALSGLDRLGERDAFRRLEGWRITPGLHAAVRKGEQELLSLLEAGFNAITPQELAEIESRWISSPELQYLAPAAPGLKLSAQEKTWLEDHKVILLGVAQDYPPLDYLSPQGEHQGLAADYLRLLEKRLGIRLQAVGSFPWPQMLQKVRGKELAGVACIAQSEEREEYLSFSKPYSYSPYMVFTKSDHPPLKSLAELAGKTVAVEQDFFLERRIIENFPTIKLLAVPDTRAALAAVAEGRAQAYAGNFLVAEHIIKRDQRLDLKAACAAPWPGTQLCIAVRRDWPQLVSILDKALDSVTTQEQAEINSKWLTPRNGEMVDSVVMALTPKERAWLEQHRKLRLGVDPNWPPFEFINPDKSYAGMASDYMRLLSAKLGVEMELVHGQSWPQTLEAAQAGRVDLLACVSQTPQREKYLNFTKPYLKFPMVIATRTDAPFITGLEDLAGKAVVVGRGHASEELLAANHPGIELRPMEDLKRGLLAVSQGSAYAFVGDLASITHFSQEAGLTNLKIAASTPYSFDLGLGVRKDWPELTGILEKALDDISPSQKSRIHNSWVFMRFEHGVDWDYVWRLLAGVVGVSLAVMAMFIYWNRRLQRAVRQRRQAEEALGKSEAQLRALVDSSADTIVVLDTERRIIDCNQAFSDQLGYQRQEALGQTARLIHLDDEAYARFGREVYPQVRDAGSWRGEWLYRRRDGGSLPMENVMSAFRGADGRIIGYSAVMRDITERKRNEAALEAARHQLEERVAERTAELQQAVQALREEVRERRQAEDSLRKREEEQRALLNASPSCIIAYDNLGRVIYVNPAFTRVFGWTAPEVIGQRIDFIPDTERQAVAQALKQVYASEGEVHSLESKLYNKQRQLLEVSINIAVFMDVTGEPVGLLANLEDITERKRNEAELRQYRQNLERLVEERTAELAVAMEKAQEADRLKSAFLASMSHELRTPLNSIIGFTGIILQGLVGPLNEEQTKQMGMVQHSARHLLSLINDVLDISKIEAGQLKVERQPFDMPRLVAEVENSLKPAAGKKGLILDCRLAPEVGQVTSDRRRVEQILINLLNNALKFTDQGGVFLDCRVENGSLVISVRDTGIGIKAEDQAKLFQAFRQIDTGLSRRYEGTGLGLNICKKLVELLGGNIWVQSAGPDQGSVFTFTLPLEGRGEDV